jgi:hypothetical protein
LADPGATLIATLADPLICIRGQCRGNLAVDDGTMIIANRIEQGMARGEAVEYFDFELAYPGTAREL